MSTDQTTLCEGCPPVGYPTDQTRCVPCPRRSIEDCPECGVIHDGECEPPGAFFLAMTAEEQDEFIQESLRNV